MYDVVGIDRHDAEARARQMGLDFSFFGAPLEEFARFQGF